MNALERALAYFDAWNAHDTAALLATFAPDGTYEDPTTGGALTGEAIARYAAGLWTAFPDLRFEIRSHQAADGIVAAEWRMLGTNRAPMNGLPPTGKSIALPGADFIRVGPEGIQSVNGYFDAGGVPRQLGLQVVVQPTAIGPFTFGVSTRVGGASRRAPGAFSITSLRVPDASHTARVRDMSRQISMELPATPGFLGLLTATVGDRMITVSAWESPQHPRQLMKEGTHRASMPSFFREVSIGGWTSTWVPERINPHWLRCTACGQMEDAEKVRTCRCGAALPDVPSYF